jgi:hypothetical protein
MHSSSQIGREIYFFDQSLHADRVMCLEEKNQSICAQLTRHSDGFFEQPLPNAGRRCLNPPVKRGLNYSPMEAKILAQSPGVWAR